MRSSFLSRNDLPILSFTSFSGFFIMRNVWFRTKVPTAELKHIGHRSCKRVHTERRSIWAAVATRARPSLSIIALAAARRIDRRSGHLDQPQIGRLALALRA